ncbi:hypothetical protein [Sphingomonas paeninsulae]|uniref:hypothetical protein n=1 Tax=Sphingomonas paeninsulae TaxID=2319844 RepID=UPI001EF1588B|nr:hypothetical protein [Sphingomonas paeninsulae]
MSEDHSSPNSTAQSTADGRVEERAAESAAIRRRWITLGEVLAVIAVAISALTLWTNWSERSDSKAVQNADAQRASAHATTLVLMVANTGKQTLALKPASAEQTVQSQKILFPSSLGTVPAETAGEPRLEAVWFEHALEKARKVAHLPDNSRGDERLPVVVVTRFLVNGEPHEDIALYDIGYTISGRFLSGHSVALRGLSLVSKVKSGDAQAKLDARWREMFPSK